MMPPRPKNIKLGRWRRVRAGCETKYGMANAKNMNPRPARISRIAPRQDAQRPPGQRQNGEAKAGGYNAPQRGPRIQIGPFEAIQRMFVRGRLPLPLGLVESLEAPFCRSDHRGGSLRVGQRGIDAIGE